MISRSFKNVTPSATQNVPATAMGASFSCFSQLPPEVRQMIWNFAIPDPRVITIDIGKNHTERSPGRYPFFSQTACFPTCKQVGMLSACRESRFIVQEMYSLKHCLHPRYIFPVDLSRDVVLMDLKSLEAFFKPRFWKCANDDLGSIGIRTLAIGPLYNLEECDDPDGLSYIELVSTTRRALREFGTVESVVLCWVGNEDTSLVERVVRRVKDQVEQWEQTAVDVSSRAGRSDNLGFLRIPTITYSSIGERDGLDSVREKLVLRMLEE